MFSEGMRALRNGHKIATLGEISGIFRSGEIDGGGSGTEGSFPGLIGVFGDRDEAFNSGGAGQQEAPAFRGSATEFVKPMNAGRGGERAIGIGIGRGREIFRGPAQFHTCALGSTAENSGLQ